MSFHGFRRSGVIFLGFCKRDVAIEETSTRSHLVVLSAFFIEFQDFIRFFMDIHAFQGLGIKKHAGAFANEMLSLKNPLLNSSWLIFHGCFKDFQDFFKVS